MVADASTGLAIDLRVRTLVLHQADGFSERGLALSLSYNQTPSTPLGLTARVAPSWGGQAQSGAAALWGQETMAGMARGGVADGRDYRLGYRLGALGGAATAVERGVDAQRRERPLQGGTDHGALARATLRW